jgi:TolB-like protein/Flp pilus assembly protein TadD
VPAPPRAIAVLPFVSAGGGQEDDWFSDGLADEILNLLTRVRELKVAASATSYAYKTRQRDLADVAKRLGVDVVLVGNVRREKERLRVGAELVDAKSGYRLWSEIYDRKLADVFSIQEDIARQVTGALAVVLGSDAATDPLKPAQTSLPAYEAYLRGRAARRLPQTSAHLDQATTAFEQAIRADSTFGPAYAGLCETWLARYERARAPESFARAESACQGAVERTPRSGDVHGALATLRLATGRYADAEAEFQRARQLDGDAVEALLGLARTYAAQRRTGDAESALAEARRLAPADWRPYREQGELLFRSGRFAEAARSYAEAVERAPDNASIVNNVGAAWFMAGDFDAAAKAWRGSLASTPTAAAYSNVGSSYYYLGRFRDAVEMYREAMALAPDDHRLWWNLGDAETFAGRRTDAAAAYRRAIALGEARLRINPADAETMSALAHFRARLGDFAAARQLRDDALRADDRDVQVRFNAALVSLALGERDVALDHLERAVALGYQRELVASDAALAALRHDPRFRKLTAGAR